MATPILFVVLALVVPVVSWFVWFFALRATVGNEFRPSMYQRVERILSPYEGQPASADLLEELQRKVEEVVLDTLVDLHHEAEDATVILRNDDLLGPVCFIRTSDGSECSLAEFESRFGVAPSS